MVPFLAAYIGYSISERAALAPCAIGAWVGNSFGAGFFGALIAGMIGGIVVYYLKNSRPKVLRSVMPIFVIPIIGTFITAGIMMWGLGEPVGVLTANLTHWLQGMQQGSILLLAAIMGLMLAFDMGASQQSRLCFYVDLRFTRHLYRRRHCGGWDCSPAFRDGACHTH